MPVKRIQNIPADYVCYACTCIHSYRVSFHYDTHVKALPMDCMLMLVDDYLGLGGSGGGLDKVGSG